MHTSNVFDKSNEEKHLEKLKLNTQKSYIRWIGLFKDYCVNKKVKFLSGEILIEYLHYLDIQNNISKSSLRQAKHALFFYYKKVLRIPLDGLKFEVLSTRKKLPIILSDNEIAQLLSQLDGDYHLMGSLLFGSGIRATECVKLRVRDFSFKRSKITLLDDITGKKRETILPKSIGAQLQKQLLKTNISHQENVLKKTFAGASIPEKIAGQELCDPMDFKWQYIFPASKLKFDAAIGKHFQHHRHHSHLQKEIRRAVQKSKINKQASSSTLRNSFAVKLVENGYDIQIIQRLLGHRDIKTTQQFIRLANNDKMNIQSPLDSL